MKTTFVMTCMEPGPMFYDGDDTIETSCRRQEGHTQEHEWWNDEGDIRLTWREGWHFAPGSWRED